MILSKSQIIQEIKLGNIIADGVLPEQISEQSIDVSLHEIAWFWNGFLNEFVKINLNHPVNLEPGYFLLGIIDEWVGTTKSSGLCCEFKLKSTAARLGLDNALALFIETGYFSRLCTEFYVHKPLELRTGDIVGQFIFHRTEGEGNYGGEGRYQQIDNLEELKKNWTPESVLPKSIKNKSSLVKKL